MKALASVKHVNASKCVDHRLSPWRIAGQIKAPDNKVGEIAKPPAVWPIWIALDTADKRHNISERTSAKELALP